jgi:two-component system response regulator LytT
VLKLLIIDDEAPARKELRFLIESSAETVLILEAKNGREALEAAAGQDFNVAFIDINLGDIDGISLARELLELQKNLRVVFATAYDAFAVKAFELNALDYILKPFEPDRIKMALERIQNNPAINEGQASNNIKSSLNGITEKIRKISLWNGDRVVLIDINEIVFVAASERHCRVCALKGDYLSGRPLSYFETKFGEAGFWRVNRSYLVNLDHILEILPWFNHSYLLKMRGYEKEEIVISRNKIKDFRLLFGF